MGNSTPSRYRREGRNAFYPGGVWHETCPYAIGNNNRQHWLEGWREAEKEYVPPEPPKMGYLELLREDYTDEEINAMSNTKLIAEIDLINERAS